MTNDTPGEEESRLSSVGQDAALGQGAEQRDPGQLPTGPRKRKPAVDRWGMVRAAILGLFLAGVISMVLLFDLLPSNQVILNEGDVATQNILAPRDLTYKSATLTKQAQDAQAASIPDAYDPPDASIARQQEIRARQILDYISTVRQDAYASPEEKSAWLAAIPDLSLTADGIDTILGLGEADWQEVREEVVRVLTRSMQGEIRESQVLTIRRRVPTLISYSLAPDQTNVVEAIAGSLVIANTFFNAARTEEAKQQARDNAPPVSVTVRKGEAIVRNGDLVGAEEIEALDAFGLRQRTTPWQSIVGTVFFAVIVTACLELIIFRLQPSLWADRRASVVTFLLAAIFVVVAKLMLPAGGVVANFSPIPALSMLLTVLLGPVLGMAMGITIGFVAAFVTEGSLQIAVYVVAGTLIGALALGRAERLRSFLRAGLAVAVTNAGVIVLFGFLGSEQDVLKILIDALVGIVMGGLAASLALAAFFALSSVLDLVTPFQLMELSRPTQPLFRQLLLKAPGTYHHTLLVANMAEEAADRIDADGLLARVGSYYHDIGKTVRPFFFTENRVGGVNPHELLDPYTSAQIIVSHVQDGLDLAAKYRLPSAIRAFIPEHQGRGMALAFYRLAVKAAANDGSTVNEEDFRYPGPRPQSKETAIVMLADSCEARVRSAQPSSVEEMERIIRETIKGKLDDGELDECDLTLRDLGEIEIAFLNVLKGVFHPRVKYPEPVRVKGADGQEVIR